jgi:glyoxylase-like metal-dependent hydrolase (beta-lactamase superfamily II)
MDANSHRFTLGEFECIAVSDGAFNYPLGNLFANVPQQEVEDALHARGLPTDRIMTPYTCLFIDTGDHRVLAGTGAGKLGASAPKVVPNVDHSTTVTGNLRRNLELAGVAADQVDTVVITHAHPDHIGGTLDDEGALVFANARYVIGRDEWEFWMSEAAGRQPPPVMVDIARRNLEPVADRLTFVDNDDEILPGIRVIATSGHTPGHLALEISSGGEILLHISDVVIYPLHLEHSDWTPAFDLLPEAAETSKRRTFDRAAEQGPLVFGHHFPPFPNLGHVRKHGSGWQWQPIDQGRT